MISYRSLNRLFALALLVGTTSAVAVEAPARPNILWLVSEDNSPLIGAYGDPLARTPAIDALAGRGIRYTRAYANAPVCAPARATLISGVLASSTGTHHMRSSYEVPAGKVPFFTSYLREAGYFTYNHGKTDYNRLDRWGDWDNHQNNQWREAAGKPFFGMYNFMESHESRVHREFDPDTDPAAVTLPPYHPDIPDVRRDWAKYYDQIAKMDTAVGEVIQQLESDQLIDDTIIFYFADHGGVLPRSKRFLYQSGTHVPLVVAIPPKWQHLAPDGEAGQVDNRLVSFIDFAPTVLSLAGIRPPDHMQGTPFLGEYAGPEPEAAVLFRGRMDERTDMSRAIVTRDHLYIRNYYPDIPRGRYLEFSYKAKAMQAWHAESEAERLNPVQSRFFEPKAAEELYDLNNDPHQILNLAADPSHTETLAKMRTLYREKILESRDAGFLPEPEVLRRAGIHETTIYELACDESLYPLSDYMDAAALSATAGPKDIPALTAALDSVDSGIRYWALVALRRIGVPEKSQEKILHMMLTDPAPINRVTAANILGNRGDAEALHVLVQYLDSDSAALQLAAAEALADAGPKARRVQYFIHREAGKSGNPGRVFERASAQLKAAQPQ